MVRNGLRELWQLDLPGGQLWCRVLQGKGYWRDVNSPSHVMRFFALLELVAAPVVRPTLMMQTSLGKTTVFGLWQTPCTFR